MKNYEEAQKAMVSKQRLSSLFNFVSQCPVCGGCVSHYLVDHLIYVWQNTSASILIIVSDFPHVTGPKRIWTVQVFFLLTYFGPSQCKVLGLKPGQPTQQHISGCTFFFCCRTIPLLPQIWRSFSPILLILLTITLYFLWLPHNKGPPVFCERNTLNVKKQQQETGVEQRQRFSYKL